MKSINQLLIVLSVLITISVSAQQGINYKALIKDGSGNVVANDLIVVQFQILQGGAMTNIYQETHTPSTDANGFVILNIGEGSVNSGDYSTIDWSSDEHFLNVQINTGAGLTDMGTTQFMAVPYALSAANAAGKIDELSDGRSDADGSSLFLGVDAGSNDAGTDNRNTAVGFNAMNNNTSGLWNAAFGYQALYSNTVGQFNTANGFQALWNNLGGSSNTAVGRQAFFQNTTGNLNTVTGAQALALNTSGSHNSIIGAGALFFNISGVENTVVGTFSGTNNLGDGNVFIGFNSGYNETGSNTLYIENSDADADNALIYGEFGADNTTTDNILRTNSEFQIGNPSTTGYAFPTADGTLNQVLQTDGGGVLTWQDSASSGATKIDELSDGKSDTNGSSIFLGLNAGLNDNGTDNKNVGLGFEALKSNTQSFNTAVGYKSLYSNTIGVVNTATGYEALYNNINGNHNTASGNKALYENVGGQQNTAIGSVALMNNTSGSMNTAVGMNALLSNTEGIENTAVGRSALQSNSVGDENTAVGKSSLFSNTSGDFNTAIGRSALQSNTLGNQNTAVGYQALIANTTGVTNTALGYQSLESNTEGQENTAVGWKAMLANLTGGLNTAIGLQSLYTTTSGNNNIAIGWVSRASSPTVSHEVTIGNNLNNVYRMYAAGWTNASDRKLKHNIQNIPVGLDMVMKLRPVEFVYNNANNEQKTFGFIAQEVKEAVKQSNLEDNILVSPLSKEHLGLRTSELISVLTKAIQEQQEIIEKQDKNYEKLLKRVEQLELVVQQ